MNTQTIFIKKIMGVVFNFRSIHEIIPEGLRLGALTLRLLFVKAPLNTSNCVFPKEVDRGSPNELSRPVSINQMTE